MIEEIGKDMTVKKSQSGNISPIWGESPLYQLKICLVSNVQT